MSFSLSINSVNALTAEQTVRHLLTFVHITWTETYKTAL